MANKKIGKQTVKLSIPVTISSTYSIVGPKEGEGPLAKYFDIPFESWITAIENTVAPKFVEMNKKAFNLGYNS